MKIRKSKRKTRLARIDRSAALLEGALLMLQPQGPDLNPFFQAVYYLKSLAKKAP